MQNYAVYYAVPIFFAVLTSSGKLAQIRSLLRQDRLYGLNFNNFKENKTHFPEEN